MRSLIRAAFVFGIFTLAVPAGINWKTIWLEPNPIILQSPGSFAPYVVKGIDGSDVKADLTHSPHLKISSSDENIVFVDRKSARLIAKAPGRVEIRISFSECTSLITVTVLDPSRQSK
jgi:hypothetical protein